MSNWNVTKKESDGIETIVITRPIGDKPKSTVCVSRTVKAGTIAYVKYARIKDDFTLDTGELVKQFDTVMDSEKVAKTLHNQEPTTKWQVLEVSVATESTLGIPRDVFNAVAVPIDRPLSQQ